MWIEYLKERYPSVHVIEHEQGFVTYELASLYKPNDSVYIVDIFVKSKARLNHLATQLATEAIRAALKQNPTILYVIGSADKQAVNYNQSVKVLEAYGMTCYKQEDAASWFVKLIDDNIRRI